LALVRGDVSLPRNDSSRPGNSSHPGNDSSLPDNDSSLAGNGPSPFSKDELLVIELADAMVQTPANISDDLYARLREKFSEEQLLQLSAQIAFENYRARLNRVFDVGSDELYKPSRDSQPVQSV
jgi:alkylhydroperoxidase family enzyme